MKFASYLFILASMNLCSAESYDVSATLKKQIPGIHLTSIGNYYDVFSRKFLFQHVNGTYFHIVQPIDYGDRFRKTFADGTQLLIRSDSSFSDWIKKPNAFKYLRLTVSSKLEFEDIHSKEVFSFEGVESDRTFLECNGVRRKSDRIIQLKEAINCKSKNSIPKVYSEFKSDDKTWVYIQGSMSVTPQKFRKKSYNLVPGKYFIMGRRSGYQEVRQSLEIVEGMEPPKIRVVCKRRLK